LHEKIIERLSIFERKLENMLNYPPAPLINDDQFFDEQWLKIHRHLFDHIDNMQEVKNKIG